MKQREISKQGKVNEKYTVQISFNSHPYWSEHEPGPNPNCHDGIQTYRIGTDIFS